MTSFLTLLIAVAMPAVIEIDAQYPGGNIVVEKIDDSGVKLRTDLRDTAGWWFYWNFRVRGAEGRTLRFEFLGGDPVGVLGPAVSRDEGRSWRWLGAKDCDQKSFRYAFGKEDRDVRFAFAIPYLAADWARFLETHRGSARMRPDVLCTSRRGRKVESLYFGLGASGPPSKKPAARVVLTCRHHACESLANFVLEGLVTAVIEPRSDDERWLSENVALFAVPFVDKDGVEGGDQGKNRRPRDHNRDYAGESIYPETRAIRQFVPQWLDGGPGIALDLHCPSIRGDYDTWIYLVGTESKRITEQQRRFIGTLIESARGPLPFRKPGYLPFGTAWNTGGNYAAGCPFGRWAGELADVRLAGSFEIPYARASGVEVNPENARAFGRDLAAALARYLQRGE